ncbi:MAG: alkaline phosphatase PhoX [Haloplanus sp.]
MVQDPTRRRFIGVSLAALGVGLGTTTAGAQRADGADAFADGASGLRRLATTAYGAEATGPYVTNDAGALFMSLQHPSRDNRFEDYSRGGIGALTGTSLHDLSAGFDALTIPSTFGVPDDGADDADEERVRTAVGEFSILASGGDYLGDGESLGVPQTPDGTLMSELDYVHGVDEFGHNPDFNAYIPLDDESGYLYSNWETEPGVISRLHLRQTGADGSPNWQVVDGQNLDLRDIGGTMINCYGSVSPWGTPMSAEENYDHTETAVWNKPGYEDAENLAYYLGATPKSEQGGVIDDVYPNPYRYGYIVEVTDPTADTPEPVKRVAMGRYAPECPCVMPDDRTVYLTSDGTDKCLYKFVADEPGDLSAGTLSAARVTTDTVGADPADTPLDIEWIELAHGDEKQIESWIAEYDAVTQADYTDGGNSYLTQADVDAWANGNAADDRVAFLETRKAAIAKGATAEFRKLEGIDRRESADAGDYVYLALSEINSGMTDDEGDLQFDQAYYGGVIYRLPITEDYNLTRLEPALMGARTAGADTSDIRTDWAKTNQESGVSGPITEPADDTMVNPDNIFVMDDGRVLVCEDADDPVEGVNRTYPQDNLWVYNPADESQSDENRGHGNDADGTDEDNPGRSER